MTIKWGDPIECNGVRPDWLRDETVIQFENSPDHWLENRTDFFGWAVSSYDSEHCPRAIRLPADHPAYVALARGFTPWSGGDSAPDDWDAAQPVLFRDRFAHTGPAWHWGHCDTPHPRDIIGYRKRVEYGAVHTDGGRSGGQPEWSRDDLYVRIVPFTRAEWDAVPDYTAWAQSVGLIRTETTAERFTRETGHAVTEAVEAALNWKES